MINALKRLLVRRTLPSGRPHSAVFRTATDVKASAHSEGAVFIHYGKGLVFSTNRVGAVLWNALAQGLDLDAVSESIGSEMNIPIGMVRDDAAAFLAQLETEGLIVRC